MWWCNRCFCKLRFRDESKRKTIWRAYWQVGGISPSVLMNWMKRCISLPTQRQRNVTMEDQIFYNPLPKKLINRLSFRFVLKQAKAKTIYLQKHPLHQNKEDYTESGKKKQMCSERIAETNYVNRTATSYYCITIINKQWKINARKRPTSGKC